MTGVTHFWARRRAAVRAEEAAERQALTDATEAQQLAELTERSDEETLAALDLPDPDTLEPGDDFTAFMAKAVPQHIRSRALRKLWRSNPVLACLDGLNDYDDDYLAGSYGVAPVTSAYQVGKGMLAHLMEVERQATEAEIAITDAPEEGPATGLDAPVTAPEQGPLQQTDTAPPATSPMADLAEPPAPARRRMQIRFVEGHA